MSDLEKRTGIILGSPFGSRGRQCGKAQKEQVLDRKFVFRVFGLEKVFGMIFGSPFDPHTLGLEQRSGPGPAPPLVPTALMVARHEMIPKTVRKLSP